MVYLRFTKSCLYDSNFEYFDKARVILVSPMNEVKIGEFKSAIRFELSGVKFVLIRKMK